MDNGCETNGKQGVGDVRADERPDGHTLTRLAAKKAMVSSGRDVPRPETVVPMTA